DIAAAEQRRRDRPHNPDDLGADDIERDCPRQPDSLFEPGIARASGRLKAAGRGSFRRRMDDERAAGRRSGFFGAAQSSSCSLAPSKSWIGCAGITVEIACLYTSCECASRRSSTQKLSNQVMIPCSLTPFTRNTVTGVLFLRTWLRNTS